MSHYGLTSHEEVVYEVAAAPWGYYFVPSSAYAPAVSETIRHIARGPSDVRTARLIRAREKLSDPMQPRDVIGFHRCSFVEAVRILCYLGTWNLALRSSAVKLLPEFHAGHVDPAILSKLSRIQEGTVRHALAAFREDGAVTMIRDGGKEAFRCDMSYFIT